MEDELRLFALSLVAMRDIEDATEVAVQSTVVLSDEDLGSGDGGLKMAHDFFPGSEGWYEWQCTAQEITRDFFMDGYRLSWEIEHDGSDWGMTPDDTGALAA